MRLLQDTKGQAADTYINDFDQFTGEPTAWQKVLNWWNGNGMTDSLVDGFIYRKLNNGSFVKRAAHNWTAKNFGLRGNGVNDDSSRLQHAIDSFDEDELFKGVNILLPPGDYLLDNIVLRSGIRLYCQQRAKDNYRSKVNARIRAYSNPDHILTVAEGATNWAIDNLNIDGNNASQPQMISPVLLRGEKCRFSGNNICRAAGAAVITSAGMIDIENNSILGWEGAMPDFESETDFRGALQIESMGDSYVFRNEISAGYPYFGETAPLRDPLRRIGAMATRGQVGATIFAFNIYENAERAVIWGGYLQYVRQIAERMELSGGGGEYVHGPAFYKMAIANNYADNSLAGDGMYDDIEIGPGGAAFCTWSHNTNQRISGSTIPTSYNKVRWHITNKGSLTNKLIASQVDPDYALKGLVNNEDVGVYPVLQDVVQFDPENPTFRSVSTQRGLIDPDQVPFLRMEEGTGPTTEGGSDANSAKAAWYDKDQNPIASIGGNPGADLYYNLFKTGGNHVFNGGDMSIQGSGTNKESRVWNFDSTGVSRNRLIVGITDLKEATFQLQPNGDLLVTSAGSIKLGLSDNLELLSNGYSKLPATPGAATGNEFDMLVRDRATGEIRIATPADFRRKIDTAINEADLNNTYLNANYGDTPIGVVLKFTSINGSANTANAEKIGDGLWEINLTGFKAS